MEALPGDATQQAAMYGPLVLAGRLGAAGLTRKMFYAGFSPGPRSEPVPAPVITLDPHDPTAWLKPSSGRPLTFESVGQAATLSLIPLYRLFGERYAVYWKTEGGRAT